MWKAYFKRGITNFQGLFTIQRSEKGVVVEKPINAVVARSGAAGYENVEWVSQKSPIPRGEFKLWLTPNNKNVDAGQTGIGEFYPISSDDGRVHIWENDIIGPMPVGVKVNRRSEIGLHEENKWAGTAGCIAIVNSDTWERVRKQLKEIGKTQPYIPIKVF